MRHGQRAEKLALRQRTADEGFGPRDAGPARGQSSGGDEERASTSHKIGDRSGEFVERRAMQVVPVVREGPDAHVRPATLA
ncbi:MAG: hypothetical protein NVS3B16_25280 [Vulcanimicrobiaceae bacterium]